MGPQPCPIPSAAVKGTLDGTDSLMDFSFFKSANVTFAHAPCSSRALIELALRVTDCSLREPEKVKVTSPTMC